MNSTVKHSAVSRARRPRRAGRPTPSEAAQLDEHVRDSAIRLFLQHGYAGTSMDAIAAAAGTTKVSLYARFASKAEVFTTALLSLMRGAWPGEDSIPLDKDDLEGSLTAIAQLSVRRAVDPTMVALARIAVTHAQGFPEIADQTHAVAYSARHQLVVDLLKHHAAKGSAVVDDPEMLAEHFLAMVSAMPARLASFGIVNSPADQKRRIDSAVQLFLCGLHFHAKQKPRGGRLLEQS